MLEVASSAISGEPTWWIHPIRRCFDDSHRIGSGKILGKARDLDDGPLPRQDVADKHDLPLMSCYAVATVGDWADNNFYPLANFKS
ncbi:hypothetical protein GALL_527010 [mine drainage metagenome]|uniref:Uncharacterized protein n=1 Tax=mine drainage metagenome TaxID=410659 RepID=A0A1J5P2E8_9ZZZZ